MRSIQNEMEFHVVTSIGMYDGFELQPTQKAFEQHLSNTRVTLVHVITETSIEAIVAALPILENIRVKLVQHPARPTFQALFDYCNHLADDRRIVVAVMNGDVSFECADNIAKCITTLNETRNRGFLPVLAITRRDKGGSGFELFLKDRIGLPNFLSSDCWLFEPPQLLHDVDFFSMGQMNCDSILAYDLTESGRIVLNPCLDVALLHHENSVKDDSFYRKEDQKTTTQNILGWHWAKRSNQPYRIYGVAWNCAAWIEKGYMPAPFQYFKKKIYILIDDGFLNDLNKTRILLVEIIAKISECDVVVLFEDVKSIDPKLIGQVAQVSRNVYFVEVDNIGQVVANLIAGEQDYHESMALIRSFTYLTPQLLNEFHSVILDQRGLKNVEEIELPNGHPNLIMIAKERYGKIIKDFCASLDEQGVPESCGLITSLYKSDEFIAGFQCNITALDNYDSCVHVMLFSQLSELEQDVILDWHASHSNLILCWFKEDPGLYECWNIGIHVSPTVFVSNANVDDLRDTAHVTVLTNTLNLHPEISVAASAIVPFEKYSSKLEVIDSSNPWYTDQAGEFGMEELARLELDEKGTWSLTPHNLPHCMPVWRKALHDRYGYFDEKRFGTFADWAFWLKITKAGETGYLEPVPLAYYYVNLQSHNRRGAQLKNFHQTVENEYLADFYFRKREEAGTLGLGARNSSKVVPKLNISGVSQSFGQHRNSFNRLVESLLRLQQEDGGGIEFIPFIERYFVWGTDEGEAASSAPCPLERDWVGILHVPFDAPSWFEPTVRPENIFSTELWQLSFPFCRGLICLAEDIQRDLAYWYPALPSVAVKHPTELDVKLFDYKSYKIRPRLVQVGDWLRRLQAIHRLRALGHKRIMLLKSHTENFLEREIAIFGDRRDPSVDMRKMVSNDEYDRLLSSSVVLCLLYATAANNVVIECIARATPILINPLPAVVEYLGPEYPLYAHDEAEADRLLVQPGIIKDTHRYLLRRQHEIDLSYDGFCCDIAESEWYANL